MALVRERMESSIVMIPVQILLHAGEFRIVFISKIVMKITVFQYLEDFIFFCVKIKYF